MEVRMNPVKTQDGMYKLGAWVRDDTQGIGTITYVEENGQFGALGHGISDMDTGKVVEIENGSLYETEILGIEKGAVGEPGVMAGVIYYGRQDIQKGPAWIRSDVSGKLRDYEIEIQKVEYNPIQKNKSIVLRVTDEELLRITGGIVQGMSGSPIIQNDKLVGAVTHVFVNDPTRGYGIFIEDMLEN